MGNGGGIIRLNHSAINWGKYKPSLGTRVFNNGKRPAGQIWFSQRAVPQTGVSKLGTRTQINISEANVTQKVILPKVSKANLTPNIDLPGANLPKEIESGSGVISKMGNLGRIGILSTFLLLAGPPIVKGVVSLIPGIQQTEVGQRILNFGNLWAEEIVSSKEERTALREEHVEWLGAAAEEYNYQRFNDISEYSIEDISNGVYMVKRWDCEGPLAQLLPIIKSIVDTDPTLMDRVINQQGVFPEEAEKFREYEYPSLTYGPISSLIIQTLQEEEKIKAPEDEQGKIGPQTVQHLLSLGIPDFYRSALDSIKAAKYREDGLVLINSLKSELTVHFIGVRYEDINQGWEEVKKIPQAKLLYEEVNELEEWAQKNLSPKPWWIKARENVGRRPWWDEIVGGVLGLLMLFGIIKRKKTKSAEKAKMKLSGRIEEARKLRAGLEAQAGGLTKSLEELQEKAEKNEEAKEKVNRALDQLNILTKREIVNLKSKEQEIDNLRLQASTKKAKKELNEKLNTKVNYFEEAIREARKLANEIFRLKQEINDILAKVPEAPKASEKKPEAKPKPAVSAQEEVKALETKVADLQKILKEEKDSKTQEEIKEELDAREKELEKVKKAIQETLAKAEEGAVGSKIISLVRGEVEEGWAKEKEELNFENALTVAWKLIEALSILKPETIVQLLSENVDKKIINKGIVKILEFVRDGNARYPLSSKGVEKGRLEEYEKGARRILEALRTGENNF